MVGGHVFNSRRKDVLDWFWHFFNKEIEFTKAIRDARIALPINEYKFKMIGYPIENHAYQLDEGTLKLFIKDLISMASSSNINEPKNFKEFLKLKFGDTLYNLYFKPYNEKIWKRDLTKVPLNWLEGKLPMPSLDEIIFNNFQREKENTMVHSSFYYARENGSQHIADRLSQNLDILYNSEVKSIIKNNDKWLINNNHSFDKVIYAGNIKDLNSVLENSIDISIYEKDINELEYHGTTSALCYIDNNPYSWIYMPDKNHSAHRIICTGNFSKNNNATDQLTATIEFTDYKSKEEILQELKKMPYNPQYITHKFTKYTYPIQNNQTREMIGKLKNVLEVNKMYLLGRFAEWEYYNMDAAMGAALDLSRLFLTKDLSNTQK